jgi:serine/threonine protein kinase
MSNESSSGWMDPRLAEVLNEFTDCLQRGELLPVRKYVDCYPDLEQEIRQQAATLELLGLAAGAAAEQRSHLPPEGTPAPPIHGYDSGPEIGRGGMGVVYAVREQALDRSVALKIFFPDRQGLPLPDLLTRFQNEATAAGRLHHTHIVPVYAFGQQDNIFYYVMPLIDGKSLKRLIDERAASGAPRGRDWFRQVARIGRNVAEALAHAHGHGIRHRDVKPGNVLVDQAGEAWLADFGLAHLHDRPRENDSSGSEPYKAPEQHDGRTLDQTDQFGLGVSLYQLLSGGLPFPGPNFKEQKQQRAYVPLRKRCPGIPRDLARIIETTLDPDPAHRYPTAQALADDLRRFQEGYPLRRDEGNPLAHLAKWVRRSPETASLSLTLVFLLILIPSLFLWKQQSEAALLRRQAREELIAAAKAALDRGDMADADGLLRRTLEYGEDLSLRVDQVRCHFALGRWEQLGHELEELAGRSDLGELRPTVLLLWGDYLFSFQDKQSLARAKIEEALLHREQLTPADGLYADALLTTDGAAALILLRQAVADGKQRGRHHRAHVALAAELLCQGRLDETRQQVNFLRYTFPDDPLCLFLDALLLLLTGEQDTAQKRLAALEPALGRERMMQLRDFANTFAEALQIVERFDLVEGEGLGFVEQAQLAAKALKLGQTAGLATQALGFPVPAAARLYQMWDVIQPLFMDFFLRRWEAAIGRLKAVEKKHPELLLLYFRAGFHLMLAWDHLNNKAPEKARLALENVVKDANKARAAPTLAPRRSFRYQCLFLGVVGEATLIQDYQDADPERLRRFHEGLIDLVIEGRRYPAVRDKLLGILAPGLDPDAARFLVLAWQNDERAAKKPAYWTATRLLAQIEAKARNYTAALYAANEVLNQFPNDKEMQQIVGDSLKGMRTLVSVAPPSQP